MNPFQDYSKFSFSHDHQQGQYHLSSLDIHQCHPPQAPHSQADLYNLNWSFDNKLWRTNTAQPTITSTVPTFWLLFTVSSWSPKFVTTRWLLDHQWPGALTKWSLFEVYFWLVSVWFLWDRQTDSTPATLRVQGILKLCSVAKTDSTPGPLRCRGY